MTDTPLIRTAKDEPYHGEIRQTACERVGDAYRIEYTMYLDRREIQATADAILRKLAV